MADEITAHPGMQVQEHSKPVERKTRRLLPEGFCKPIALLAAVIVPQTVLQLLNWRSYLLVSGDMSADQIRTASLIFGVGCFIILGTAALAMTLHVNRGMLRLPWCGLLFALCAGYLAAVTYSINGLIPSSASLWIVPSDQLLYYQWMLVTPGLFYTLCRLACFDSSLDPGSDVVVSFGAAAIGLLTAWIYVTTFAAYIDSATGIAITFIIILTGSIIIIGGLSRGTLIIYRAAASRWPRMLFVLTFLIGLAGPICGLLLNRKIPFPGDFQTASVYVLAAINGVALILPNFASRRLHLFVWLLLCALFPYTLYFFLLFLPWLPLGVPMILFLGAGFLILTPMLLFLVHGQRIADGFAAEVRDEPAWKPALLGCAAMLAIPAWLTGQALMDRVVLHGALDYFYSPDYLADRYSGNRPALRRSLERLRDFKAGVQLPFLSDYYNWIVFDNLVLPDEKIQAIHRAVFGADLEAPGSGMFSFGSRGRDETWVESTTVPPPPSEEVDVSQIRQSTTAEGVYRKTVLHLDIHNGSGNTAAEYAGRIVLSDGVLISGYKLNVGKEMVPGRIFEKKTAQWVYRQIRDRARCDPGLLSYTGPNDIELRVYPFGAGETRPVELELLYPPGNDPVIHIDGRPVTLGEDSRATPGVKWLSPFEDSGAALGLDPEGLAPANRRPYLHFIIERSRDSQLNETDILGLMRKAALRYPEASDCLITAANYQFYEVAANPIPLAGLSPATLAGKLPPTEGGFLESRAIKRALLQYDLKANEPGDHGWMDRYPVIIVLRGAADVRPPDADLQAFERIAPDASILRWRQGENFPEQIPFGQGSQKVALLEYGDTVAPCEIASDGLQTILFPSGSPNPPSVALYDEQTKSFRALGGLTVIPPDSRFSRGMAARRDEWLLTAYPDDDSRLAAIVSRSRATGVLTFSTSYMVVEADAQWKIVERKENQKLQNSAALELDPQAIPEPGSTALLAGGAALVLLWRFGRKVRFDSNRGKHSYPKEQ